MKYLKLWESFQEQEIESVDNIRYPITSRDDLQSVENFLDDTFTELFDQWGFSDENDSELRYSYWKHYLDQKVSLSLFVPLRWRGPLDKFVYSEMASVQRELIDKAIELSKKVDARYKQSSISWYNNRTS